MNKGLIDASVAIRAAERQQLEAEMNAFLARGGRVQELGNSLPVEKPRYVDDPITAAPATPRATDSHQENTVPATSSKTGLAPGPALKEQAQHACRQRGINAGYMQQALSGGSNGPKGAAVRAQLDAWLQETALLAAAPPPVSPVAPRSSSTARYADSAFDTAPVPKPEALPLTAAPSELLPELRLMALLCATIEQFSASVHDCTAAEIARATQWLNRRYERCG